MARGQERVGFLAVVDPRTERSLADFAANGDLPVALDGEGESSLRDACQAENYQLVLVDTIGRLTDVRREWTMPDDEATLTAEIDRLLAEDYEPPPPGDTGLPSSDVVEPAGPGGDARREVTTPTPDVPATSDAPVLADVAPPRDLPSSSDAAPDAPADGDGSDAPPPPPEPVAEPDGALDAPFDVASSMLGDFAMKDRNPASPWYGQVIGPGDLTGNVYLLYLANGG